jgi:AcrR family transcriptional regulator
VRRDPALTTRDGACYRTRVAERRDEILAAARALLLEEGLRGVSMRKVAERVGISATAIYRHYPDKNALVGAAVAEGSEALGRAFTRALAGKTPAERLLGTGRAYLRFAFRNPEYYQVLFMAWGDAEAGLPAGRGEDGPTPAFQFLIDRVAECVQEGLLPTGTDLFEVAMLCWSVCHGLASLYLAGGGKHRMPAAAYGKLADRVLTRTVEDLLRPARAAG